MFIYIQSKYLSYLIPFQLCPSNIIFSIDQTLLYQQDLMGVVLEKMDVVSYFQDCAPILAFRLLVLYSVVFDDVKL